MAQELQHEEASQLEPLRPVAPIAELPAVPKRRRLPTWWLPASAGVLVLALVATGTWGFMVSGDLRQTRIDLVTAQGRIDEQSQQLSDANAESASARKDLQTSRLELANTEKLLSVCKSVISLDSPSADLARQIGLIWRDAQGSLSYEEFGRHVDSALQQFGTQPVAVALSELGDCLP